MASPTLVSLLSLPPSIEALGPANVHLLGLAMLLVLLLVLSSRLAAIHALLAPQDARKQSVLDLPSMLIRKGALVAYGAYFLVLSKDKVSKKQLAKAHAAHAHGGAVEREIRLIFVRHGESTWNYVFNRGFYPSFLLRLIRTTLHELYLLPYDDSAYIDSPLSDLGLEQCASLQRFLRQPCLEPLAQPDFAALTQGESSSLLVSSPLRRAAATVAIALSDRLRRSSERVALNSSCQEISRNFDTMALAPKGAAPRLALPDPSLRLSFDAAANAGNKSTSTPGYSRLMSFAQWASERPESTLIIGGHSLWFRSFFQCFLPPTVDHVSKKRKIVNCGVVGLTLQAISNSQLAIIN